MPAVAITTVTGNETFKDEGSTEIRGFYLKTGKSEEVPFHIAPKDRTSGMASIGQAEFINASDQNANHGKWVIARYTIPEFSCLKVLIKRKRAGDWTYQTGAFLLYARRQAALRRFRIPLVGSSHSTMSVGYFEGNFDILRPQDFEALGYDLSERKFSNQYEVEDPDAFFMDEIIESEVRPLSVPEFKTITTRAGEKVKVIDASPRRLIRTRPK